MIDPRIKQALISEMRDRYRYNIEVQKWEGMFFELIGVQLKEGLWKLEKAAEQVLNSPVLTDEVDGEGKPVGFVFVIPVCSMQASPIPDRVRLIVPPSDPKAEPITYDVEPSNIQYVTTIVAQSEEAQAAPPREGNRIVTPNFS